MERNGSHDFSSPAVPLVSAVCRLYLQSKYENAIPAGPLQNGNGKDDPGGAEEFIQQEGGQTCSSGSDSWPESLDEVAKLAGFPEGLGTKKKPKA